MELLALVICVLAWPFFFGGLLIVLRTIAETIRELTD